MSDSTEIPASSLTTAGKTAIIVAAFLRWFFAGMHLDITSLAMGSEAKDLLKKTEQYEASVAGEMSVDENGTVKVDVVADKRLKSDSSKWFGYYVCALLFGGALGGLVFGRIGDRFGRVKGMMAAICGQFGCSESGNITLLGDLGFEHSFHLCNSFFLPDSWEK